MMSFIPNLYSLMREYVNSANIDYNKFKDILEFIPENRIKIKHRLLDNNHELITCIHDYCQEQNREKFIVSLSGGVDSMVLITIIHYLGYDVIGVHINYNNRSETIDEEQFLYNWCSFNSIRLYKKSINEIKRANSKRSDYEIITKNMRLDFYREVMEKEGSDLILLGHHKDDIVENIFANVCRGRYILDLAVIRKHSMISDINIGRPMIEFYKQIIYDFANKYQIPYFKDTTPEWSVRGKYRNMIYPVIEDAFTKNVKDNLIGLSNQSYEWNELIYKQIIHPFIEKIKFDFDDYESYIEFNIDNYRNYPLCFWNVVFMNIFNQFGYSCPSRKGIQTFMNNIKKQSVRQASISNHSKCFIKNSIVKIEFKNKI
jgi:tRNA(Ile)-lysidine synthetase-like protein